MDLADPAGPEQCDAKHVRASNVRAAPVHHQLM
jgi:hypothetical protein